jgi:hypothetical protein
MSDKRKTTGTLINFVTDPNGTAQRMIRPVYCEVGSKRVRRPIALIVQRGACDAK